jgi:crotonobetainyl-CoA:carnitine CoA-transferase CaiB-like acyl-CoA transferase
MSADALPLRGVRVIDFTWIVAGPQATRILADFGADVIRVEYEPRLDSMRLGRPAPGASPESPNASGFFNNLNRNKRSVTLNLHHPDGAELFRQMLMVSDVVVENFSATVMERLGWAYEAMAEVNPGIIYLSLSGFGHLGRDRAYVTWGPTAQAVSGATAMSGLPGRPPAGWGYSYLDHTAGYYGAAAILLALHHRARTGEGQYIDLSQVETGMVLAGPALLDAAVNGRGYLASGGPAGNRSRHPRVAPHNTYRCRGDRGQGTGDRAEVEAEASSPLSASGRGAGGVGSDGRWVTIACFTEEEWSGLVEVMGSPDWTRDPRFATNAARTANEDALDALIEQWTREQDPYDVMFALQSAGVPAGVVQSARDKQQHDPQLRARNFYPRIDHPELGRHAFEGMPVTASRTPWRLRTAAPLLGEHIRDVYCDLLGHTAEQLGELIAGAVL